MKVQWQVSSNRLSGFEQCVNGLRPPVDGLRRTKIGFQIAIVGRKSSFKKRQPRDLTRGLCAHPSIGEFYGANR
jgi:hypothetical protein